MTSKSLIFLSLLSLAGALAGAAPPTLESEPIGDSSRAIASLIDYQPKASHFGGALKEPATLVEEGFRLLTAHQKPQSEQSLKQAIEQLQKGKFKLSRGEEEQIPLLKGLAYEGLGDQAKAIEQYDATLKIQPTNILAHFRRGLVLSKTNRCSAAVQEFHEVEWYLPAVRFETSYLVGMCLLVANKPVEAERLFEESLRLNPAYTPALRQVIQHRMTLLEATPEPDKQRAIAASIESSLATILAKDPEDHDAARMQAKLLLRGPATGDQKARAELALQRTQKLADDSQYKDDAAVRLLIQALTKKGDLVAAQAALARGLQANPKSAELAAAKQQLNIDLVTAAPSPTPSPGAGSLPPANSH